MTGGNVGDRPLTQSQPAIPGQPHPGNEAGDDWNRDQQDQILDRVDGTSRKPSARRDQPWPVELGRSLGAHLSF